MIITIEINKETISPARMIFIKFEIEEFKNLDYNLKHFYPKKIIIEEIDYSYSPFDYDKKPPIMKHYVMSSDDYFTHHFVIQQIKLFVNIEYIEDEWDKEGDTIFIYDETRSASKEFNKFSDLYDFFHKQV